VTVSLLYISVSGFLLRQNYSDPVTTAACFRVQLFGVDNARRGVLYLSYCTLHGIIIEGRSSRVIIPGMKHNKPHLVPCKKRPPDYVKARIYPLPGGSLTPSIKALISVVRLTLTSHINTESRRNADGRVSSRRVVGITVVVDNRKVSRTAAIRGGKPPVRAYTVNNPRKSYSGFNTLVLLRHAFNSATCFITLSPTLF
jgi:hypothetical protein